MGIQIGKLEIWWEYEWNAYKFVRENEPTFFEWTLWFGPFELTWFKDYADEEKNGKN